MSYSEDYQSSTGDSIPDEYIERAVEVAVDGTLNDPEFEDALVQDPDIRDWEEDWYREFLYSFVTIDIDYPIP
jgi:hypothetical protein